MKKKLIVGTSFLVGAALPASSTLYYVHNWYADEQLDLRKSILDDENCDGILLKWAKGIPYIDDESSEEFADRLKVIIKQDLDKIDHWKYGPLWKQVIEYPDIRHKLGITRALKEDSEDFAKRYKQYKRYI